MMSKKLFFIPAIITMALFVFVSCSNDDDFPAPIISDLEIGYENSKVGYRGHDLHIDADILAEGRIDRIVLEIHHEEEHAHKSGQDEDQEWEFVHSWTEFNGQKNATFHKHIDIPLDAELGSYHFYFKVIDLQGKVTEIETEFEVKDSDDDHDHDH
ncbi:MAG: DUF4625 domain-containing protein [Bacteroidota bacterium]